MARAEQPVLQSPNRIVGNVVHQSLSKVKPNDWNPNKMTPFLRKSLKQGLLDDGWLSSQALLVWGTDEKGRKQNTIIDGEHRWTVAKELGFTQGPMVFLAKLTKAQAKGLTVKMNQKRGAFDEAMLGTLLRDIQFEFPESFGLSLGIEDEKLMKLLAEPPLDGSSLDDGSRGPAPGEVESGMASHVRMVQLFFDASQHEEYLRLVKEIAPMFKTQNVSDTTLEAMRRAGATANPSPRR